MTDFAMQGFWIFVVLFLIGVISADYVDPKIDHKEVRCLVCKALVHEMDRKVNKIDPRRKIDIGNYHLDAAGNKKQKQVPYARSELHLTEVMETICNEMEDYVRGTWKENNTLGLIKLIDERGSMNPLMSEMDLIQDSDLNKSLKFYCEGIVEEYEEPILKLYADEATNMKVRLCEISTQLCPSREDQSESDMEDDDFASFEENFLEDKEEL